MFPAPDTRPSAKKAFTLIELLVVIVIIAILAGLLLPALARAKEKGRTARCVGNVRQMALALTLYVDDFHHYPPWRYFDSDGTQKAWYNSFAGYLTKWTNNTTVFSCPSYKYKQADALGSTGAMQQESVGSYGYNALTPWSLGADLTIMSPRFLKENAVIMPSAMIGFGDSYLVQWQPEKFITGTIDLQYVPISYRRKQPGYAAELKAVNERHGGKHVIAFCDGHVELIKFTNLFSDDVESRRIWNFDHQPHVTPYD